jgi:hypothetical protein
MHSSFTCERGRERGREREIDGEEEMVRKTEQASLLSKGGRE